MGFPSRAGGVERAGRRRLGAACHLGCRLLLAAVFLMAAVSKITALHDFENRLLLQNDLPAWLARSVAAVLPWLELTCAGCLLFGRAVREASAVLAVLLLGFLGYAVLHWGETDCGCFLFPVMRPHDPSWWPVARDALLLGGAVYLAWWRFPAAHPSPDAARGSPHRL